VAGDLKTDFILSEATAEHVKDQFDLKSLGKVSVAGRTGEIVVYTLA